MEAILDVIRFLATPYEEHYTDSFPEVHTTASLLSELCGKAWKILPLTPLHKSLLDEEHSSSTWKLTVTILSALTQLRAEVEEIEKHQNEDEKSIEVLSIQSQACVSNCVQLVLGFGILPYLLPGVGIPDKYRKINPIAENLVQDDKQLRQYTQYNHLFYVIRDLTDICNHPTFANLIISRHLNDLLAGLLQLWKSPIAVPQNTEAAGLNSKTDLSNVLTLEEYSALCEKRTFLNSHSSIFLQRVSKVMLVKSLLFIGANPKRKWMMISCHNLLHGILLDKNGLATISKAFSESLENENNWLISKTVSNLMFESMKSQQNNLQVMTNVCSQCVELIRQSHNDLEKLIVSGNKLESSKNFLRLGLFCATTLTIINNDLAQEIIWSPIFNPVLKILEFSDSFHPNGKEVLACADIAHALLSLSIPADIMLPTNALDKLWSIFLNVLLACENIVKQKKQFSDPIHQISVSIRDKIVEVISLLLEIISNNSKVGNEINASQSNVCQFCVQLIAGSLNGSLSLIEIEPYSEDNCNGTPDSTADTKIKFNFVRRQHHVKEKHEIVVQITTTFVKSILMHERLKDIRSQVFCQLLTYDHNSNLEEDQSYSKSQSKLQHIEDCHSDIKFIVLMLLDSIAAEDENILENCSKTSNAEENDTFKLLELIAIKLFNEIENSDHNGEDYEFSQTLSYFLGILGALCETTSTSSKDGAANLTKSENFTQVWEQLDKFLPYLKKLSDRSGTIVAADAIITAQNIVACIESRGKIYNLNQNCNNKSEKPISRYEKALQDVNNPIIPIKGNGILELKRLIEEKDKSAIENEENLLRIFQNELKNEDSYIYLMSINGMAALAYRFHESVLLTLVALYDFREEGAKNVESKENKVLLKMTAAERCDFRLKIGEIIVKVIQKLQTDIAPRYRVAVTNACFHLLRDEDESIRASALSTLGELCQVLKLALGNILTDVWDCVSSLLESEKSFQVRRAALHLMVLLLRGVAKELDAEYLIVHRDVGLYVRDARRLLVKLRTTETDPVAITHIQLAMDEIAFIAAKFFMLPPRNS